MLATKVVALILLLDGLCALVVKAVVLLGEAPEIAGHIFQLVQVCLLRDPISRCKEVELLLHQQQLVLLFNFILLFLILTLWLRPVALL